MVTQPLVRNRSIAGDPPPPDRRSKEAAERPGPRELLPPQVVYPLELPKQYRGELGELKDPREVESRIREAGSPIRLNRKRTVKPNDTPKVLEVRHDRSRRVLELRWVWVRQWMEEVTGPDGIPRLELKSAPAVSSFVVHLETGLASLRLPRLESNTLGGLQGQYQRLRRAMAEMAAVFDLDRFQPVRTEPVIRKLLRSDRVRVQKWSVHVRGRGPLSGAGDPGFLRMIVWSFQRIQGQRLLCEWLPDAPAEERVLTRLFGASNRIDVLSSCQAESLDRILAELRDLTEEPIRIPEIAELVRKDPGNKRLRSDAERIDYRLEPNRRTVLELGEVFGSRKPSSRPPTAVKRLVHEFPDVFRLEPGDRLVYRPGAPVPEHGLLYLLKRLLAPFFPHDRIDHLLRILALWLFTILFSAEALGTGWIGAILLQRYPDAWLLLGLSFLICLVPLAALAELVLGEPATGRALRMLRSLGEMVAKLASTLRSR